MIELKVEIQTLETLHIGSGVSEVGLVGIQSTIKDHRNSPIIPGSTLKGAIRLNYRRLFPLYQSLYPNSQAHSENDLFGSPNRSSLVYFSDSVLATDIDQKTFIHTRVRINNKTRTSEEGGLFQHEKIFPFIPFKTTILMKSSNSTTFHLLLHSLKELEFSGLGHNRSLVKITKLECENKDFQHIIDEISISSQSTEGS